MPGDEWRVGNVPARAKGLVGRQAELRGVRRAVGRSRLVTLTGVAGVGKTRLAQEVAATWQPGFQDGVWWVELSPLPDGKLLTHAIAGALRLADRTTRLMLEVLVEYLAGRQLLLVLDTCEHLVEDCREVVATLLTTAPQLRILATSRCLLGLVTEEVFSLDPLPVPADDHTRGADHSDALTLLVDRAAEAAPAFTVTGADRTELVRLCRRLEGLPLAIELAAARLREMPPAELNQHLQDRFTILGETEQMVYDAHPPWHQALRTAIGWSHQLCAPAERLLWARLSVFAGSFDVDVARRVCADDRLAADSIPALLSALSAESILSWRPTGGAERYRMLDTLREYGAGWLRRLGEEEVLRRRHRDFYLVLAREGDAAWLGPDQFAWRDRMTAEHDNLRVALEFALGESEGESDGHAALDLAGALWFFWHACGFPKEGQHYLERALAEDTEPSRARTRALWVCGDVRADQGDISRGAALAAECADEAERVGDVTAADEAATLNLVLAVMRGDLAQTLSLGEGLIARRRGDAFSHPVAVARVCRSHALIAQGRYEAAIDEMEKLRLECVRSGERWQRAYLDLLRAKAESACGRAAIAHHYGKAALEAKHRLNDSLGTGMAIDALAEAAAAAGHCQMAARLLGLGQQVWDHLGRSQMGIPQTIAARRACEQLTRQTLDDHAYQTAFNSGYHTDLDTGIAHALRTPGPSSQTSPQHGPTG